MKFKIVDITKGKEESSLFNSEYLHYQLETPSGLKWTLKYHETEYSEQENPQQNIRMETVITPKLIVLSQEDLLEYFNNYASKSESAKRSYQRNNELGETFERFEDQQKGAKYYGDVTYIQASNIDLIALFNEFKNQPKNIFVDIPVNKELLDELVAIENKNEEITTYNSENLIQLMAHKANAKVKSNIDKSTDIALSEMKSGVTRNKV